MLVILQSKKTLNTLSLPKKVKGQYWLTEYMEDGNNHNLLEIEGVEGVWRLKSTKEAVLVSMNGESSYKYHEFKEYDVYRVQIQNSELTDDIYVYTEPDSLDRKIYTKYQLRYNEIKLYIGRNEDADIRYAYNRVSSSHAILEFKDHKWLITDDESTNGTYVNGMRLYGSKELSYGDVVYIVGLKIIVCNGFFAMNHPDDQVGYNHNLITEMNYPDIEILDEDDIQIKSTDYYWRSPRFKKDIRETIIKVDSPPAPYTKEEMPLIMVLGPSITMGIASAATASYSIYNAIQNGNMVSAIPSMTMALSMMLGTILWPILSKRYEKKRNAQKEAERVEAYSEYLCDIKEETNREVTNECNIIEENNNPASYWSDVISTHSRKLWERTNGQNDFLMLRVGVGDIPSKIKYNYQERRFTMDKDNLQLKMLEICENPPELKRVPITVSLQKAPILGVVGEPEDTLPFLTSLIVQMSGEYGYDEVKYAFIMNRTQEKEMAYIRRLPHIWSDEKNFRYLATDYMELKELSNYFEPIIDQRVHAKGEEQSDNLPYYIFIVTDKKLADKAEVLKQLYKQKKYINISVVYITQEFKNLPKECSQFIELFGDKGRIFDKGDVTGKTIPIIPEYYHAKNLDDLTSILANTELDLTNSAYNLPKMITFLDLYGVGKIEHLNAELRWKENNPVKSLITPIGIDTMGEIFNLDLHEKYHGPHGLVAGMTGSGKSEFIMTFILSMALNYHPYEVAFVLIDYKGGGMAKAFEKLPHTAGIITNLDGAAVNRSLVSIQSELKRRQAIFSEAGKQVGESNIDIYKYQQLYREGKVSEPLQHLFIVSDEFAELKTQQPDFMEQLVSAARIGRSLGVHLILATQKPAGVVDDQIWSNSRFRICLKVQDRADSMDMLKRPDAASLTDTGRFYLQVGYNELFELGQSAWAGAPYIPSEKAVKQRDTTVELLDQCGLTIAATKLQGQQAFRNAKKQLDEITAYLAHIAEEEAIHVRPLWLEPIPEKIYEGNLRKKYQYTASKYILNPIIGEYDDPARQRQALLTMPLSEEGNAIVYGTAGNGKTTFLTTVIYSMLRSHSPEELTIYILDFSSETLRAYAKAPHVGDVMTSADEDKILNMFKYIKTEIARRKQICSEYGGDYASYIAGGHTDLPNIVIIIHNYAGFSEIYEDYEEYVQYQSREGVKYGIYYILSAISTSAVRYRLQQNFKQMYVLQMNDSSEYATVLGSTGGMVPSKIKGRGLVKMDEIYEFQTAYVGDSMEQIKTYSAQLLDYYGERQTSIQTLPEYVTADSFHGDVSLRQFPVGIAKETVEPVYINLYEPPISVILGKESRTLESFMMGFLEQLVDMENISITFMDGSQSLNEDLIPCDMIQEDFEDEIVDIYQTLLYRNNHYKDCKGKLPDGEVYEERVIIMYQSYEIRNELTDDAIDKLKIVLEKNMPEYNVHFVLIDSPEAMFKMTREPWFRHHVMEDYGIFIGNGINDKSIFRISSSDSQTKKSVEAGFGYVIQNGETTLCKMLMARTEVEDE